MKRLMAFILTLCLVASMVPVNPVVATGTGEQNNGAQLLNSGSAAHSHYACSCALEGGNACAGHSGQELPQWSAWTDTSTLPTTTGSYYLTGDLALTNTAVMTVAAGQNVTLCLNGFSIGFNAANTAVGHYRVEAGATLTIMNCRAKLDSKGLFVAGNKADTSIATAGRLYGNRSTMSAVQVLGTLNTIGVNFYDNGKDRSTWGGAVRVEGGGVMNALHTMLDSNKGSCGGAIAYASGDGFVTLDDTIVRGSQGTAGGAIYLRTSSLATESPVLTLKGDTRMTDNICANAVNTGSGGAIYSGVVNGVPVERHPVIILQDNVVVTNNTSTSNKGAITLDHGTLKLYDGARVYNNRSNYTGTSTKTYNFYFGATVKVILEEPLNGSARVFVPNAGKLQAAQGVTLPNQAATGIFLESGSQVGYSNGVFAANDAAHKHYNGACAITGDTACTHAGETEVTYKPWTDLDSLPTAGNWYLVGDVVVADTTELRLNNGQALNLCLNGHSIKFNENLAANKANFYVNNGATLNIVNCLAKLDDNGLFACGNKYNTADSLAGHLYGGRGTYGGGIYDKGTVTLTGVAMSDNVALDNQNEFGGAIRVQNGGVLNVKHSLFADNHAGWGGAIAAYQQASTITVDKTRFEGNTALAQAKYPSTVVYTAAGRGGAIHVTGQGNNIAQLTVTNSVFTNNRATDGGAVGGIHAKITLENTKLSNNIATVQGGAIFLSTVHLNTTSSMQGVELTVKDCQLTENEARQGGALFATADKGNLSNHTVTLSGSTRITGNKAFKTTDPIDPTKAYEQRGSAIFLNQTKDTTGQVTLTVKDDVQITGNHVRENGAIYLSQYSVPNFTVSGNVQISGNTSETGVLPNIYFWRDTQKLSVGQLSQSAQVRVATSRSLTVDDADDFLRVADNVTLSDVADARVVYDNLNLTVGYSTDPAVGFHFGHLHAACGCVIPNSEITGCTHTGAVEWTPWTNTKSLPTTTGNYYLTGDITLTNTAAMEIAAGQKVNLCLNGYSIKFNGNNAADNYKVLSGAELTIMNCQAQLDNKGLMVCGDRKDTTDQTAGRLQGSRGTNGAIHVAGTFNAIGVEFYDNQNKVGAYGYGGAIVTAGGAVNVSHSKFTDNQTNGGGAVIGTKIGNATITLHDIVATGNKAANGALVYMKVWKSVTITQDLVLTVSGDSQISGNSSTASGSVVYTGRDPEATEGVTCQIILKDNVSITGNTASGTNGAVVIDTGLTTKLACVSVSGNVQVTGNVNTNNSKRADVCLNTYAKLKVGKMGSNADVKVYTFTGGSANNHADPDGFMIADGITEDTVDTGIFYVNHQLAVGYDVDPDPNVKFTYNHAHYACGCELENSGATGCSHEEPVEYRPWTDVDSLPTKGSWYLTQDLVITDPTQVKLNKNEELNLCLNGFSIQFNPDIAKTADLANYYMDMGSKMTVINCQAKLDDKGLLECGDKNDVTNEKAGRLFGGRGLYGGAIYVKGELTLIGVELYDNQVVSQRQPIQNFGGALRVQQGGIVHAEHSKFDSNFAQNNGGAIAVGEGNAEIYLHDTIMTNNGVEGATVVKNGKEVLDDTKGRGGAIYFYVNHIQSKDTAHITKDPVLMISGDSVIEGNTTGETWGGQGAAIAVANSNTNGHTLQFTIKDDVQIVNNTARAVGAAIYVNQASKDGTVKAIIKDSVKISGNTSQKGNGGAIYINQAAATEVLLELTIQDDVIISGNTAAGAGGAIYLAQNGAKESMKVDITDNVQITDNTAGGGNGGAICMVNSNKTAQPITLNITDNVKLTGNKASADGGAIAVKTSGNINIDGAVQISDNAAGKRGGGIFIHRPVNVSGSVKTPEDMKPVVKLGGNLSIVRNSAAGNGGGVYISNDDHKNTYYLDLSGSVQIRNNTTESKGPNLYLWANNGQDLGQKLRISGLTDKAEVYTTVNLGNAGIAVDDPDEFMIRDENVALADTEKCGVIYESINPPVNVGYSNKKKTQFYFAGEYVAHEDHVLCACVLTGDDSCKHKDNMEWTAWIYTDKLPTKTGNYYLSGDVVITSNAGGSVGVFEVKAGQKVNLCLNGYSIKFSDKNSTKANYYAMQGSELNVINCKAKLDENNRLVSAEGGKITNGRGLYGGAFYVKGNLSLIGIELSGNQVINTYSQNAMLNGYGGAVRIQAGGILRTESCLFQNNKALVHGGAIAVGQGDAEVYLHDTVLKDNEVVGVYTKTEKVDGKSVTTISATKDEGFKLDESRGRGGAIHFNVSSANVITKAPVLEISGNSLIQNNKTNEESGGQGGAIAITNGSPNGFTMEAVIKDNTQILDNTARAVAGAIYVNQGSNTGAPKITICDNVKISGNKTLKGNGGAFYVNISKNCDKALELIITDNVQITGNSTNYSGGAIYMQQTTQKEAAKITISGNAKISENKAGTNGGAMTLTGGFVLNIAENAEISNNKAVAYAGAIFATKHTKSAKGVEINISGGKITKNEAPGTVNATTGKMKDGYGGGIYIKQGVINMTGGEISENKGNNGGGVFFNTTKFTFTKGTVTKNYATTNGGGLATSQFSELIMNGPEAVISYNTADSSAGGALIAGRKSSALDGETITKEYGSILTMAAGKIMGNTAKANGNGIYVSTESRAVIKGGSITGNTGGVMGGGIYLLKGEVTISGGSISGNEVSFGGGAMSTNGGKVHIYGGSISYNKSNYRGGGIRTYGDTELIMTGGEVSNNTAAIEGGGFALETDAKITGGYICNNTLKAEKEDQETRGAGIAVLTGNHYYKCKPYVLDISNVVMKGNEAQGDLGLGGALFVNSKGTINVKDVTFENNTADDRGGAIMVYNLRDHRAKETYANIDQCSFTGNEAGSRGGAIFSSYTTETRINDCTFTENKAEETGGAICLRRFSSAWIKNSEFTQNTAGQMASAIYVGDDIDMQNLTITGNNSGDGYALYFESGEFDGESYVSHKVTIGGDMKVCDNQGSKPDMFIGADQVIATNAAGLTAGTKMNIELAEGILTNTLIGAYNYEGGDRKYVVTAGDRSVTDPEPIPVVEPEVEDTTPATEPTATGDTGKTGSFGVGGVIAISAVLVVGVIAVLAAVAVKKKKKAEDSVKDTVQE